MEVKNNIPQFQPAFQANIDIHLASELRKDAARISKSMLEKFDNQLSTVVKWGDKASEISESIDFSTGARRLVLNNDTKSSLYGGSLPMAEDNSLLTSFLNLRKSHILKAEKEIEENVSNNKLDIVSKAFEDDYFAEKLTEKILPSDEEVAAAIDRLSEQEIVDLRFGLDNKPAETGKLLNFVV